jgi:ferric-dicitrate binding protein FerR (iron transport regulator)
LRTGAGAQALIELSDGTHLALNEQTTVVIRPHRPEDRGIIRIFKLFLGEIWIRTSKGPPPLEVETPVAIAAIRGTEFNLKVLRDGRSELTVLEGEVEFGAPRRGLPELRGSPGSPAGAICPVRAGTTSVGEKGKPCTPPAQTDVRRATAWIKVVK